ncbi:MAG: thiamine diphosphokinase [Thermoplasmata archaeon M9B1D]|nr:MAG: thiamine diphosphokinase [Thermoplasmata archaeon M9B1D]
MKNKIAIIANGYIKNPKFHKDLLKDADIIICADGGANNAKKIGVTPNYIIGDLDSASKSSIELFKDKSKIIKDNNPDKTDMELALSFAETLTPSEILITGAIGDRIDHTLANIMCLDKIKSDVKAQIVDEKNIIELVENSADISGDKNDIISIVPITDISNLCYTGLKWNVENLDTNIGWFGISNRLEEKNANISFSNGKILLIRIRE